MIVSNMNLMGEKIKSIRKANNKYNTQEKFAEFIDISTETVSNIERGTVVPRLETILNIAEKCNVSLVEMFGIEVDKNK